MKTMHIALAASSILLCGVITACGSDSKSDSKKDGSGEITIAAFGGTYGEAEQVAYFEPFTKATGIKVNIVQAETTLGAVKVQVESGDVLWDIAELPGPDVVSACSHDLITPVDYKEVKKEDIAESVDYDCGVLASEFVMGIGYNTEEFDTPPDWETFFDTDGVSGKRTMEKYLTDGTLEYALLADGVDKEEIYPLDLDRATAKLRELGDDLVLVDSLAQASQLLTSGDAVMIQTASGRILPLQSAGLPVGFSPVGLRGTSVFTVPNGAANTSEAMKFLAYVASCTECSQAMARATGYAGANAEGREGLSEEVAALLPSDPQVQSQTFQQDDTWWSENAADAQTAFDEFSLTS